MDCFDYRENEIAFAQSNKDWVNTTCNGSTFDFAKLMAGQRYLLPSKAGGYGLCPDVHMDSFTNASDKGLRFELLAHVFQEHSNLIFDAKIRLVDVAEYISLDKIAEIETYLINGDYEKVSEILNQFNQFES